jgi:hypothetical protein
MTGDISVYLKTPEAGEPADTTYYVLAANGIFLAKRTPLFASITEARTVAGLEQQAPSLVLTFPKLPRNLLERIYGFFQFVYRKLDGEAVVFIYYSPERGEFHIDAPPQTLTRYRTYHGWRTAGNVEYGTLARPTGFLKLGDAHSHADCPAFFSSTDDRDDVEDGLRVVMGRLDRSQPDVCVSFVASGTRFKLEPGSILENFNEAEPPLEEWTRRVTCRYEDRLGWVRADEKGLHEH